MASSVRYLGELVMDARSGNGDAGRSLSCSRLGKAMFPFMWALDL